MLSALISRLIILAFGTLYPAYSSYKAVRTRDVKEYVKWMMYWIVFALFTFAETFTDVLLSFWFPFYYEFKIAIVFWLLSPATKGSSFLYRNFVHPALQKREGEIDEYLSQAKEKGYSAVMSIGSKGVNYATNVIVQTALKGGGGLMDQLRKSYSLSDLTARPARQPLRPLEKIPDQPDKPEDMEVRGRQRRSVNLSGSPPMEMYFSEVDVNIRPYQPVNEALSEIRSVEDVSSGYCSAEGLYNETGVLTRASSVSLARGRGVRPTSSRQPRQPRSPLTDEEDWEDEEMVVRKHTRSRRKSGPAGVAQEVTVEERVEVNEMEVTEMEITVSDETEKEEVFVEASPESRKRRSSSSSYLSLSDDDEDSMKSLTSTESEGRAGRYNKRKAPGPPERRTSLRSAVSALATTLESTQALLTHKSIESDV